MAQTKRVSAIRSQNGHGSQWVMSRSLHVVSLITLTPEPPLMMHPGMPRPLMMIFTAGFRDSMRGGPIPGSARLTGSEVGLTIVVNEA